MWVVVRDGLKQQMTTTHSRRGVHVAFAPVLAISRSACSSNAARFF